MCYGGLLGNALGIGPGGAVGNLAGKLFSKGKPASASTGAVAALSKVGGAYAAVQRGGSAAGPSTLLGG